MEAPEISNRSGQVGFGIRRPRSGFSIWSSGSGSKVCSRLDAPCTTLQARNAPCASSQELYSRPLPNSSGAILSADDVGFVPADWWCAAIRSIPTSGCSFGHWGPSVWYHNNNSQQDLHEPVHKLVRRSFLEIRLKVIWLTVGPYLCRLCLDSRPRTAAVYLSRYASRTNASVCLRAGVKTNPMNQTRLTHLNVTE